MLLSAAFAVMAHLFAMTSKHLPRLYSIRPCFGLELEYGLRALQEL